MGDEAIAGIDRAKCESEPNDALLRFVRALARAAAIPDYNREHRPTSSEVMTSAALSCSARA